MKVLKFGGTSVGTPKSLRNVNDIVKNAAENERVIVVVSALGGITDKLIQAAQVASDGNLEYIVAYSDIVARHLAMVREMVPGDKRIAVESEVSRMLEELGNLYRGISLIKDLSQRTLDMVVAFGERMSSYIIANVIVDAIHFDSRKFIKTAKVHGKHKYDSEESEPLIKETFIENNFKVAVVPGFISMDTNGDVSNLGRGGSDYTAAILAAVLGADSLEIWTDVNGVLTADPRIISTAKVVERLSYSETMTLCTYGAKVIYPPTVYPVFRCNVPMVVKNTHNPAAPGTLISEPVSPPSDLPIKGLTTINKVSILSLRGSGVEEVANPMRRINEALLRKGIEPLLVSIAFHENRILVALKDADAERGIKSLSEAFYPELQTGALSEIYQENGYSTLTVVGDNMKNVPGIAGRLSMSLSATGAQVIASSQGAMENKMVFVVKETDLLSCLETLHKDFIEN